MKFGPVPPQDAEGGILAHATRLASRTLKKGHVLGRQDCLDLAASGQQSVTVARLEPGDVTEDAAAQRLAGAANGGDLAEDIPFTGRVNLYAEAAGMFVADTDAVMAANRINPSITIATLANHTPVSAGRMVATAKIIPFAVSEADLARAEHAAAGALRVAPFRARDVGLVATELPHLKAATMDKTRRVLDQRLAASGSQVRCEIRIPHRSDEVAVAIKELADQGADFLILFGASAMVDAKDILPEALEMAGGRIVHLGMPVDPGNLLMLGDYNGLPVIGAPGCARSPKENGFDWVLDRLLADLPVTADDITAMGVGGLLMEIGTRPQPREVRTVNSSPRIGAIVLGAGRSRRMGGPNKLLATLGGKSLIRYAAEAALGANLAKVVVVTGHLKERIEAALDGLPVELAHNPDFAEGMAGSIRTGMLALGDDIDAVIILLGDMPGIDAGIVRRLADTYLSTADRLIVTATAGGKRGNPVLWDRRFFDALKGLAGDVGARHIIAENPGFVAEVEIGDAARLDLDTPEALRAAGGQLPETDLQ